MIYDGMCDIILKLFVSDTKVPGLVPGIEGVYINILYGTFQSYRCFIELVK